MESTRFAFSSGLISPDMSGRIDVDHYGRSCDTLDNFILLETGAIQRRTGSKWLATLPALPLAVTCIRWTSGLTCLILAYKDCLETRYTDGTLWLSSPYPSNGGSIRFHQINDLILILNNKTTPYTLKNNAGTLSLAPINHTYIPLEGNWNRDFPLHLADGKGVITDKWDAFTLPNNSASQTQLQPQPGHTRAASTQYPINVVTHGLDFMSSFRIPSGSPLNPWQTIKLHKGLADGACWSNDPFATDGYASPGKDTDGLYYWYITQNITDEIDPNKPSLQGKPTKVHLHFPWITIPAGKLWKLEAPGNWQGHLILQKQQPDSILTTPIGELRSGGAIEGYTETPLTVRLLMNSYSSRTGWAAPTQLTHYTLYTPPVDPDPNPDPDPSDPPVPENPATPITSGTYKHTTFHTGDTIAIRYPVLEKTFSVTASALTSSGITTNPNLQLYNYPKGTKFRASDGQGNHRYWISKKFWQANPKALTTDNLNLYPSWFEPGLPFCEATVGGAYEYTSYNKNTYNLWAIQTSQDGSTWQTIQTQEDTLHPDQEYKYTGDNNGDPVLMRCALLEHHNSLDLSTIKKTFRRKTYKHTTFITITQLYSGGTFEYALKTPADYYTTLRSTWEWDMAAFRPANGFPLNACLHASRLVYSGTAAQPQTLWFSCVDDLYNFRTGTAADQAMLLTYSSATQSTPCWMASSGPALILGSTSGEIAVKSARADLLSSSTAVAQQYSNCGSSLDTSALLTTDALMFIDRSGARLRRIGYSMESESYTAKDMTIFASGLLSGGIRSITWQRAPQPVAWTIPATGKHAGKLCGMTYNPDQNIAAWFTWTLGDACHIATTPTGNPADPLYIITRHLPDPSTPDQPPSYALETIDYQPRDTDGTGGPWQRPFTATLLTSQLDTPDAVSKHRNCPKLEYLLLDCDLTDATLTTDGLTYDPCPLSGAHSGWTPLLSSTAGSKTLKTGITLHHGHGKILSIRALGDQKN